MILGIFVFWGLRALRATERTDPCANSAIFGLVLLPVAGWIYALLLHWEVRNLVEAGQVIPAYSRLQRLHQVLVIGVVALASVAIGALTSNCARSSPPPAAIEGRHTVGGN